MACVECIDLKKEVAILRNKLKSRKKELRVQNNAHSHKWVVITNAWNSRDSYKKKFQFALDIMTENQHRQWEVKINDYLNNRNR